MAYDNNVLFWDPSPKMPTVVFTGCLFSHINSLVTGNSTHNIIGSNIEVCSSFCFLYKFPWRVSSSSHRQAPSSVLMASSASYPN